LEQQQQIKYTFTTPATIQLNIFYFLSKQLKIDICFVSVYLFSGVLIKFKASKFQIFKLISYFSVLYKHDY